MAKRTPLKSLIRPDIFGISADIPRIVELELGHIERNPHQPRQIFDESALQELAASIAEKGLLQPIVVRRVGEGYMIVAGERRYRATQLLSRTTIAAVVTDGDSDEIALIENMQREDLKPVELAEALARLVETHQYTHEVAAKMLGKARNTVTELLSLNRVLPEIREECRTSDIASKSLLVELARLEPEKQVKAWEQIKSGAGTVRAARARKVPKGESASASLRPSGQGKAKLVISTRHGASVIIQSESSDELAPEQVVAALQEALKSAKKG